MPMDFGNGHWQLVMGADDRCRSKCVKWLLSCSSVICARKAAGCCMMGIMMLCLSEARNVSECWPLDECWLCSNATLSAVRA